MRCLRRDIIDGNIKLDVIDPEQSELLKAI